MIASKEIKFTVTLTVNEEEMIVIHNALWHLKENRYGDTSQKKVASELYEGISTLRGFDED